MIHPKVDVLVKSDVLVVGGGLAGCFAAIAAREAGADVVLVDKGWVSRSGQSPFAAGIFTVFDPQEDNLDVWLEEMIQAGEYFNHQEWVRQLLEQTYPLALRLDDWGRQYKLNVFEKDAQGRFIRRRSRGHVHSRHNLINALPMMDTLRRKVKESGVKLLDKVMVTDLVAQDGRLQGALGFSSRESQAYLFLSRAVVLAASGCAFKAVYMGHKNLTGDLQAAAYDAGVVFQNMESTASNTCARNFDIHGLNLYVSVGGKFLNGQGQEFMWNYHPVLGNRARLQDLVISFSQEIAAGRGPIHLDMSAASEEDQVLCRKILPETFRVWDRAGINPFKERIEWIPAFRGTTSSSGGISIDLNCETNLPGLFAAGDITQMPPQGTYTFGGINLAFAVVSGDIAGRRAGQYGKGQALADGRKSRSLVGAKVMERLLPLTAKQGIGPDEAVTRIQEAVIPYQYIYLRNEASLKEAQGKLAQVQREVIPRLRAKDPHELAKVWEAQALAKVAPMIIESALFRKESRGFHYRTDFPRTDNRDWLKWIMLQKQGEEIRLWTEEIPSPHLSRKEDYSLPPGARRTEE